MNALEKTVEVLARDSFRMECLTAAREIDLPDWYLAAGFLRNAIWDQQHSKRTALNDLDLVFFSQDLLGEEEEVEIERRLNKLLPGVAWEVRNQARMHLRNQHNPYTRTEDAIAHWPEIPTCVGVRLEADGSCRIAAPLGLSENWGLAVRPNPDVPYQPKVMRHRVESKQWLHIWPRLQVFYPRSV